MADLPPPDPKLESSATSRDPSGEDSNRELKEDRYSINISIGGNVAGDIDIAGRDIVKRDLVDGDSIAIGDVSDSPVAIGRESPLSIHQGVDAEALQAALAVIVAELRALQDADPQAVAEARDAVEEIIGEAARGGDADASFVAQRLRNIARLSPEILQVVTATLANPASGVALVVQKVAAKARHEADLDLVG